MAMPYNFKLKICEPENEKQNKCISLRELE